ncbi:hypothetical protein [Pseudovibrio ascidiaceicola]|uniref:hypothetical protein n=1 Tax=Pseudovibrio ascidiaceicola TaxID=285279 RepID=UPI001AD94791|nr:hypothetical protein [Pseudovibrio ascidiaceicola]
MNEKTKDSKLKSSTTKRRFAKLTTIVTHFFDTVWATGVSVAAAVVFSVPVLSRKAYSTPCVLP